MRRDIASNSLGRRYYLCCLRLLPCQASEIYRDHYCRYECLDCGRWFNDLGGTVFENSKIPLRYWFYAMRERDKGLPTTKIAEAIPFSYPATLNMAHKIRRSQYHHRIRERLSGEVEIDNIHIKTGRQGLKYDHRPPRKRGMKARGRGRYETDRPLVVVWVTRGGPGMAIEMCRDAGSRTLSKATLKHVVPGSRLDTDTWKGYNWLGQLYDHHTVKHSEEADRLLLGLVEMGLHRLYASYRCAWTSCLSGSIYLCSSPCTPMSSCNVPNMSEAGFEQQRNRFSLLGRVVVNL